MTNDTFPPLASYLAKLERRRSLPPHERDAFLELPAVQRHIKPHELVLKEGKTADHCVFVLHGLISRQKSANRVSHIISINFPGDAVDMQTLFFRETDHTLVAHEPTTIVEVPHGAIIEFCDRNPFAAKMLWHDTLVDSAVFREWAMNIGHRRAPQRIGFLLLEFEARLAAVGRSCDGIFEINLTQQELASALGLSLVHMNKSLRRLREEKMIATRGREIHILDKPRLVKMVGFDPNYLQIETAPAFDKPVAFTPSSYPAAAQTSAAPGPL